MPKHQSQRGRRSKSHFHTPIKTSPKRRTPPVSSSLQNYGTMVKTCYTMISELLHEIGTKPNSNKISSMVMWDLNWFSLVPCQIQYRHVVLLKLHLLSSEATTARYLSPSYCHGREVHSCRGCESALDQRPAPSKFKEDIVWALRVVLRDLSTRDIKQLCQTDSMGGYKYVL